MELYILPSYHDLYTWLWEYYRRNNFNILTGPLTFVAGSANYTLTQTFHQGVGIHKVYPTCIRPYNCMKFAEYIYNCKVFVTISTSSLKIHWLHLLSQCISWGSLIKPTAASYCAMYIHAYATSLLFTTARQSTQSLCKFCLVYYPLYLGYIRDQCRLPRRVDRLAW